MRRNIFIIAVFLVFLPVVVLADGSIEFKDGKTVEASSCRVEGDDIFYTLPGSPKEYRTNFVEVKGMSVGEQSTVTQEYTPQENKKNNASERVMKKAQKIAVPQKENRNSGAGKDNNSKVLSSEGLNPQQKEALMLMRNFVEKVLNSEENIRQTAHRMINERRGNSDIPDDYISSVYDAANIKDTASRINNDDLMSLSEGRKNTAATIGKQVVQFIIQLYVDEQKKAGVPTATYSLKPAVLKESTMELLDQLVPRGTS